MIPELVEFITKGIVADDAAVAVTHEETEGRIDVSVSVASDDYGRVIGRGGQTINAVRCLAQAAGRKQGVEVSVDIADPESRFSR